MPRHARIVLPGYPHHLVHRGVNRCAIFVDDGDRHRFKSLLRTAFARWEVRLHAYVLMDNHVHLLATPSEPTGLAKAMHSLAQRYSQHFNFRHRRTGGLWEGRFKSFLVGSDRYLLAVCRYIELNPVRAGLVEEASAYRWSSVHANLGKARDPLVEPHHALALLGPDADRPARYADWLARGTTTRELAAIRRYSAQERALGSPRLRSMVEKTLGRPASGRERGRPTK